MSNDVDLLPCPFCGEEPGEYNGPNGIEARCKSCGVDYMNADTWNTRAALAAPQQEPVAWVCGENDCLQFAVAVDLLPNRRNVRALYCAPVDPTPTARDTKIQAHPTPEGYPVEGVFGTLQQSDNQLFRMGCQIRELTWADVPYPDLLKALRSIQAENSPPAPPVLSDEEVIIIRDATCGTEEIQFDLAFARNIERAILDKVTKP